jgi:hypothetical protein
MRCVLLFSCFVLGFGQLTAQFVQVAQGAGYADAVYLDLDSRTSTAVPHEAWDIAFTVTPRGSGVVVNEGIASASGSQPVAAFLSSNAAFAETDTFSRGDRLYNDERSWEGGAFASVATPGDPFDLGWGTYNPATQSVDGSRNFLVQTRNGAYHRLRVLSLSGGSYTFVHARADGSADTDTVRVDKSAYAGKTLAYFSFAYGLRDLEPDDWDLLFTRYSTPLEAEPGEFLDYTVTGVLQNSGVSVAKLSGVDPATVAAPPDEEGNYSDTLTTIGYDWKTFLFASRTYEIPDDLVYFVATPDSTYRLQFIDFEGGQTGVTTFSVAGVEGTTGLSRLPNQVSASSLFPNPAPDWATLEFTTEVRLDHGRLDVVDINGRILHRTRVPALNPGTHRLEVGLLDVPRGNYLVRLTGSAGTLVHHLVKQ